MCWVRVLNSLISHHRFRFVSSFSTNTQTFGLIQMNEEKEKKILSNKRSWMKKKMPKNICIVFVFLIDLVPLLLCIWLFIVVWYSLFRTIILCLAVSIKVNINRIFFFVVDANTHTHTHHFVSTEHELNIIVQWPINNFRPPQWFYRFLKKMQNRAKYILYLDYLR